MLYYLESNETQSSGEEDIIELVKCSDYCSNFNGAAVKMHVSHAVTVVVVGCGLVVLPAHPRLLSW